MTMRLKLRKAHRISAFVILTFAVLHILNHLISLYSIDAHINFMAIARKLYRNIFFESVLIGLIGFQIISGIYFFVAGIKERKSFIENLQAFSGLYLSFFLGIHVSAVLIGRMVLKLDTNFYFAAAGFFNTSTVYFFAPYYFLAVFAIFCHIGCAFYWLLIEKGQDEAIKMVYFFAAIGFIISAAITLSLAGKIHDFQIPLKYLKTYEKF